MCTAKDRPEGWGPESTWGPHMGGSCSDAVGFWVMRRGPAEEEEGTVRVGPAPGLEAPVPVWEPRWMRWLTMMLFPKPPIEAMVVLCSRWTTAVIPPSAISRRIRARASSPEPKSGDSPGAMRATTEVIPGLNSQTVRYPSASPKNHSHQHMCSETARKSQGGSTVTW